MAAFIGFKAAAKMQKIKKTDVNFFGCTKKTVRGSFSVTEAFTVFTLLLDTLF